MTAFKVTAKFLFFINLFIFFPFYCRSCFDIQFLNARRAALAAVNMPLSPENSQSNLPTPSHLADFHPPYRIHEIPGYMELYIQSSINGQLRKFSSLNLDFHDINFSTALGYPPGYLSQAAAARGDVYPSNNFGSGEFLGLGLDGSNRLGVMPGASALQLSNSSRSSINASRKRALLSSPFADSLDVSHMIRCSPNSLYGSRNSNVSGSFGHLSATALSNEPVDNSTTANTIGPGTPMSISRSLEEIILRSGIFPGHYISPNSSMFSLAHHHPAVTPMQVDSHLTAANKSVSFIFSSF